jgi:uncharacterized membrane protein
MTPDCGCRDEAGGPKMGLMVLVIAVTVVVVVVLALFLWAARGRGTSDAERSEPWTKGPTGGGL